jgi:hypothetical protein
MVRVSSRYIEQEGSRFPEMETARRCLEAFRATHGGR